MEPIHPHNENSSGEKGDPVASRLSRRSFVGRAAALGGAWLVSGCTGTPSTMGEAVDARRVGVQLYTLRDRLRDDFEGTLEQVAAIGYREVETHDYFGRSPQQVRALLDRLGLASPAAHIQLGRFRDDLEGTLAAASVVGNRYVVVPFLDASLRNAEGFRAVAADLNRWGRVARDRGLRVAYHNHDFEFAPLPGGGTGMDILLAETDPQLVEFELDIYWAVKAGQEPLTLFAQHPGRFPLWHVKDMVDRAGTPRMADVGTGEIDFPAIFAQSRQAGMTHFFVERDDPTDSLASIRTSFENLRQIL